MFKKLAAVAFCGTFLCFNTFVIADQEHKHHTFVFVHGATGGAWDWKEVGNILEAKGHTAYRATLTGLGERRHLASKNIDLSTHITDIVNLIRFEELDNVVLVGHSYGGLVLSGVMNEIPERIQHATFLDATTPDHGQSALDVWGPLSNEHKVENGLVYFSWLEPDADIPKDVPHPLATLSEKLRFDNPAAHSINASFVAFVPPGMTQQQRQEGPQGDR